MFNVLGVWKDWENMTVGDALLVTLIAIVIVFLVLVIIIFIAIIFQKGIEKVDASTSILPKKENEILATDEDAVVAVLAASIDFYKETGKEPEVISVKKVED